MLNMFHYKYTLSHPYILITSYLNHNLNIHILYCKILKRFNLSTWDSES